MKNKQQANDFADHWIKSWNERGLAMILSHYADDFEMSSPGIAQLMGESTGKLKGKNAVQTYWAKVLIDYPELHFEKLNVLVGCASVTIIYNGVTGLSAEVFYFSELDKVYAAYAHYEL